MVLHKIAIPTVSPNGLHAPIENRFGRCNIFTIIIQEESIIKEVRVEHLAINRTTGGPGYQVSNFIIQMGITDLFVGRIGPNAYHALANVPNLRIYQIPWDSAHSVKSVLDLFNSRRLSQFNNTSFPSPPGRRHRHGRRGGFN